MGRRFVAGILGLALALAVTASAGAAPTAPRTIFRNVHVLPMDREVVLRDRDVVVQGGSIVALTAAGASAPGRGDRLIEGEGGYLIPGLVDSHVHPESPAELALHLAKGVTTVLAMSGEALDWRQAGLDLPGGVTRVVSASDTFNAPGSTGHYAVRGADAVPAILDHQVGQGAAMIKTYSGVSLDVFQALAAGARERGVPLVGHVPTGAPMELALTQGLDLVAHSEELTRYVDWRSSTSDLDALVGLLVRNGVAVTPSLSVVNSIEAQALRPSELTTSDDALYLPSAIYQSWLPRNNSYAGRENLDRFVAAVKNQYELQKLIVGRLNRGGVLLLFGTDAPDTCVPGLCVDAEFRELKAAGLSNYEALRSATFNPGLFLAARRRDQQDRRIGVVAAGAAADLVLLKANPLEELAALNAIDGVMVGGTWRSRAEIDRGKAAFAAEQRRRHAMVDRYEALVRAADVPALLAFLKAAPAAPEPLLRHRVVASDARALAKDQPRTAVAIMEAARRLMLPNMVVHNLIGELKLDAGDRAGAEREFRRSLEIAPMNAAAVEGLGKALSPGATHP